MRIRAPERNARVRVLGRKGFEDGSWRDDWRRRREKESQGGRGREEWCRPLGSVAEIPFALSRGGLFFAAHKMAAAPTRLLHLVRGCRGLEFSPSCSLYTIFVRSFVRSLARTASPSRSWPTPPRPFLPLIVQVPSTPSSCVIYPSSWGVHPFLCTSDRHYSFWREAKFNVSFSLISFVFLPRFFFSSKVIPLPSSFSSISFLSFPLSKRFLLRAATTTRCSSEVA